MSEVFWGGWAGICEKLLFLRLIFGSLSSYGQLHWDARTHNYTPSIHEYNTYVNINMCVHTHVNLQMDIYIYFINFACQESASFTNICSSDRQKQGITHYARKKFISSNTIHKKAIKIVRILNWNCSLETKLRTLIVLISLSCF